ncbi:recombinase family protein [Geobacter grbiciae]|uniref:recombinase family protein n=1 Tax=Geobacter grbiciae TaxID=155042 RepID=UPI001C01317B|nr:recombinase family protein [Geobacter grbiciae]MBT1073971.1 recombinase family protein [Geobacter grbiciae]
MGRKKVDIPLGHGRKTAIYIRKSREEKGKEAHRLVAQREQLPAFAKAQGWQYEIYDDGNASAMRGKVELLKERARLEMDIRAGKIGLVLCIELSRLSRDDSLQDYVSWLYLCAENGVKLGTLSRTLDPSHSSDWMLLVMEGGFSSVEMRTIMARMQEGREQAYLDGKWLGGTPSSPYRYDAERKNIVIDQEQLKQMEILWTLAEKMSAKAVAKQLGLAEITVRRAISDDRLLFYQGLRVHPESTDHIKCEWEPVMNDERAVRIRAARRERKNYTHRRHAAALLSNLGLVYCGYCGRTVKVWQNSKVKSDGSRTDYYGCQVKNDASACPKSRLCQQSALNIRVTGNLFGTLEFLDNLKRYWLDEQSKHDPTIALKELAREEEKLQLRKNNLVHAISEGIITPDDARERMAEIQGGLMDVQARRNNVIEIAIDPPPDWHSLHLTEAEFAQLDFGEKRMLIKAAIERIDLYENYAIITYRFPRRPNGDRTSRIHLPPPKRGQKRNKRRAKK